MQLFHLVATLQVSILFCSAALEGSPRTAQDIIKSCPPGQFPCNSTDTCVEQRKNCDNVKDCEDGSDEWHCEDFARKQYWNRLYRKRPDEDREKRVRGCELEDMPSECRCSGRKLFCDHQDFERPPEKLPRNVFELDLSGNRLRILESKDFQENEQLHTLILTSSEVTLIEKNAFINLPKLENLYLTANRISALGNGTLSTSRHLTNLVISHNPLSVLPSGAFEGLHNLEELDLRECKLVNLPIGVFDPLVNLQRLWLDGNEIQSLNKGLFRNSRELQILSISRNQLQLVIEDHWTGLVTLKSLSLSQNALSALSTSSFGNITSLMKLDLHGNKIKSIDQDALISLPNLESLDLRKNELKKLGPGTFDALTSLNHIYFDDFHLCSVALHVRVCEPRGDGISSIAHLLDSVVLRVSVWLVACVACVGNLAVLIGRLMFFSEPNEVHSFYIKNLSLADLLMSVYLFIIAAYDVVFRGHYIRHEAQWRQSWQCNFCGFLSTLSSESSIFILTVITSDRYMSIMHPLSVKKRTIFSAFMTMALAWAVAILVSALPMLKLEYYGDEFYGNNGVCLPLHIHDPFGQAWEYSTFLFCGVNLAAFLFILFAYISMFLTISHSKIGLRCTQQQQDRNIAKRFAFIVATDFLCWVPIVFIKVIAMGGVPIQEDLYAWVAIFLLPVNSALNPILYTLTTKLFKQHLAQMVYNFKVTSAGSGDSVAPSCGRNHSTRSHQKDSFSRADNKSIALVMGKICADCRLHRFVRQSSRDSNTFELTCPHGKKLTAKRQNSKISNAI